MNSALASSNETSGGGRITSEGSSVSAGTGAPLVAHELEQLLERVVEVLLVPTLARRHRLVVEIV